MAAAKKTKVLKSRTSTGFYKKFYEQIPVSDLETWSDYDKKYVANTMYKFMQKRNKTKRNIDYFILEKKHGDWTIPYTVIKIVSDDMPFLIDSITSELNKYNLTIETLFHPVLSVKRNTGGDLDNVVTNSNKRGYKKESLAFICLEQVVAKNVMKKVLKDVNDAMDDVKIATSEWPLMIDKISKITKALPNLYPYAQKTDIAEAKEFLEYLQKNNFTFLGYRYFKFSNNNSKIKSLGVKDSGLGVLKIHNTNCFGQGIDSSEIKALKLLKSPVMISKIIDMPSRVHRKVPMDAISIKTFDKKGNLSGMHLFVGLFTFSIYSCRTNEVPIVRKRVAETLSRAGFSSYSHDKKTLEHVLEKIPRDELFQMNSDKLQETSMGIVHLQARQRVALFLHMDQMKQYMSCLVYVPRDNYNTKFKLKAQKILEKNLHGKSVNYFTSMDDSPLARILFTIVLKNNDVNFDKEKIEQELINIGRDWTDRLKENLIDSLGKREGAEIYHKYGQAFDVSYCDQNNIHGAVHDINHLQKLIKADRNLDVDLYKIRATKAGELRLKVYHKNSAVPLSNILPLFHNLGFRVSSENPYKVKPLGIKKPLWIHDFIVQCSEKINIKKAKEKFEDACLNIWRGHAENDGLNKLILLANLSWQEIVILRTYKAFMRQGKFPFSDQYVEEVLNTHPDIALKLIQLFKERHDPKLKIDLDIRGKKTSLKILEMLQSVDRLDHDRILRAFHTLIEKTLRTNFFQTDDNNESPPYLSIKLESKKILELPLPRPDVEIFVYSTRVEAVHLRGGKIARGGIRWSDRRDDFRTEVLGLMKAQMVKNAVIVPVGSKGGFFVKQPPLEGGREAFIKEGIECYKTFMTALLRITDNNIKGKVIRPKNIICYDDFDPYFVVAADKGTATFSDIANSISAQENFWLDDAFASGGSAGYDHKVMGITARGAWESVKRHFREMDKDIQKEEFTVIGVGDMGGDVFGNGMLLSKKIKLFGAFNHIHIFCDPNPDTDISFKERKTLFKNTKGWDSYDIKKLSKGGKIYNRSDKSLKLTPQIKKVFNIDKDNITPNELIRIMLKADTDLLWFGGIGTYIKGSKQSHADVDDKNNDNLRVNANELNAKVIGEGANLGVTQLARVEFSRNGGRLNTDFIDNSAGVDCSDHEVNIKILLSDVMLKSKMTLKQRNKLMERMSDDVAELVLRDNYQQTQALSLMEFKANNFIGMHTDFIKSLEKSGVINRELEGLPDNATLNKMIKDKEGLSRPELAVLFAYSKMMLYKRILISKIPDDKSMEVLLFGYFPKALHKYDVAIKKHKLRREIIATQLINIIVNRMGPLFIRSRTLKTGSSIEKVVKSFLIVANSFYARDTWKMIESLDNKIPANVQMKALYDASQVVKRAVTWFLRFGDDNPNILKEIKVFKSGVNILKKNIKNIIPKSVEKNLHATETKLINMGMPDNLAKEISILILLASANDIIMITRNLKSNIKEVASLYFQIGERFNLDWLRQEAIFMTPKNNWQARVISGIMDDLYSHQASITLKVLENIKTSAGGSKAKSIEGQLAPYNNAIKQITEIISKIKNEPTIEIVMLTLVNQRIGQLVYQLK